MPVTPSPLRYPGGKTAYSEMLTYVISQNNIENCIFSEAFAGGAGAAVSLLLGDKVQSIILNDYDFAIYSFWKSITDHTEAFIKRLSRTRISMRQWNRQKEIYNSKNCSLLDLGFATFFLNRCNHSGILSANPIGGLNQSGKYNIKSRFKKDVLIKKIRAIAEKRDRIEVFNLDAIEFIKELTLRNDKHNIFVYFDPPYYQKGQLLYLNYYNHNDHKELSEKIKSCGLNWLLSYDNHKEIKLLYSDYPIYEKNLRYTISGNTKNSELIITGLDVAGQAQAI